MTKSEIGIITGVATIAVAGTLILIEKVRAENYVKGYVEGYLEASGEYLIKFILLKKKYEDKLHAANQLCSDYEKLNKSDREAMQQELSVLLKGIADGIANTSNEEHVKHLRTLEKSVRDLIAKLND